MEKIMGSEMGTGHIGVYRGCYASCARPSDTSQGMRDLESCRMPSPTGPSTQYLGTWDLGNSSSSTSFGQVYDYWVLGPSA